MNLDQLQLSLQAAGAEVESLQKGSSRALILNHLPAGASFDGIDGTGPLWIVEGEIADLLPSGAHVQGAGILHVGTLAIPASRVAMPTLRALEDKIGEGPDNLARRAGWFGKRGGPSK